MDIAAAAVHLAHVASGGEGDDREIPAPAAPASGKRLPSGPLKSARGRAPAEASGRTADGDLIRLFVGAGRRAGIRPGDLVGAITGEAGIESQSIGAIEINDGFSLVEVPETLADAVIDALRATKLRGSKVTVRRER
jgi:ATP-dependent RNA helicase DeaD